MRPYLSSCNCQPNARQMTLHSLNKSLEYSWDRLQSLRALLYLMLRWLYPQLGHNHLKTWRSKSVKKYWGSQRNDKPMVYPLDGIASSNKPQSKALWSNPEVPQIPIEHENLHHSYHISHCQMNPTRPCLSNLHTIRLAHMINKKVYKKLPQILSGNDVISQCCQTHRNILQTKPSRRLVVYQAPISFKRFTSTSLCFRAVSSESAYTWSLIRIYGNQRSGAAKLSIALISSVLPYSKHSRARYETTQTTSIEKPKWWALLLTPGASRKSIWQPPLPVRMS